MLAGSQRDNVNYGGKIIMPPSALDQLTRLNIAYPMQFELRNNRKSTITHAGVLEFIAEEGRVYLPHWMMKTLKLEEGDLLQVLTTDLLQGTFVKLEPQSVDFLKITDPKAVLENTMRNFSTLTKGDIFQFSYNDNLYEVAVLEVKPEASLNAISVIETDLSVDFAAPKGYVEPDRKPTTKPAGGMSAKIGYEQLRQSSGKPAFASSGQRMNGKSIDSAPIITDKVKKQGSEEVVPAPLRLPKGTLFFGYELRLPKDLEAEKKNKAAETGGKHFAGQGQSIKESNKKGQQSGIPTSKRRDEDVEMHDVIEID